MRRLRNLTVGCLALVLCPAASQAGSGLVALQTAAPSCRNNSGNIYVNCGNGTVTDNRTGLVWLAKANCVSSVDWYTAMEFVAGLADLPATSAAAASDCGLNDGSSPGEWRLPSVAEWEAMVADALGSGGGDPDCTATPPTITNDAGGGCWASGPSSFSGVQSDPYWASTTFASVATYAWYVNLSGGVVNAISKVPGLPVYVWPVRGGQ